MRPFSPEIKAFGSVLFAIGAGGLVLILSAWLPSAPASLRHWVRHWGRVRHPGCRRCLLDLARVEADRKAEQAWVEFARRARARIAFGKVGAP